jgi:hypothetical protein
MYFWIQNYWVTNRYILLLATGLESGWPVYIELYMVVYDSFVLVSTWDNAWPFIAIYCMAIVICFCCYQTAICIYLPLKWLHFLFLLNSIISFDNGTGRGKRMPTVFICFYIIVFIRIWIFIQSITIIVLPIDTSILDPHMTVENRYINRGAWMINYELVFSYGSGVFLRIRVSIRVSIWVKRSSCEKSWSARNVVSAKAVPSTK